MGHLLLIICILGIHMESMWNHSMESIWNHSMEYMWNPS